MATATAAADSWKVRFEARVVQGDNRCSQVPGLIAAAQAHLEAELLTGNTAEARNRIQQAEESLRTASNHIDFAYSLMAAANAIALRGGGTPFAFRGGGTPIALCGGGTPIRPLSSFHHLRGGGTPIALRGGGTPFRPLSSFHHLHERDPARWNAIGKLQAAEKPAKEALDAVGLCRAHLKVAGLLLDFTDLPGINGLIRAERRAATLALGTAWEKAKDCATLTDGARQDVAGAN